MSEQVIVNKVFENDLSVYSDALQHMRFPILLMDKKGDFVYANRAALLLTGYTKEEFIKLSFGDLFNTDRPDDIISLLASNQSVECTVNFVHGENIQIPAEIKAYGIRSHEKRNFYYQILLKNIHDVAALLLEKPLDSLTARIKEFNVELEQISQKLG